MNINNILVYGERLGDLLDATDLLRERRRAGQPEPPDLSDVVMLFRAFDRAAAELLLEHADAGSPYVFVGYDADMLAKVTCRVFDEIDAVIRDPLCLQAHPALASVPRRREIMFDTAVAV